VLYHNILNEQEMVYMTEKVMSSMEVATVVDYGKSSGKGYRRRGLGGRRGRNVGKVSMERSQASGWLWDHHHPILYKLARRVSRLTGLETHRPRELLGLHDGEWEEAEAWQMGLYGPGGHYLPHFDAFDSLDFLAFSNEGSGKVWRGNRMATIMFYLTDLVGGATAFPNLGVAARPRRGSGVFWYNMWEDGVRIPESLHGACPTALGIKWVSNKWIREGAQVWKRPCPVPYNNTLI